MRLDEARGDAHRLVQELCLDQRWGGGAENATHLTVTCGVESVVLDDCAGGQHLGSEHALQLLRRARAVSASGDEDGDDARASRAQLSQQNG
jgi:hypothetical protein